MSEIIQHIEYPLGCMNDKKPYSNFSSGSFFGFFQFFTKSFTFMLYIPQKTFEFAKVNHFMVRQWSHDVIRSIPEYFTVIGFNISIM